MYDLIIIGGGPAGVAAGVYAARKKMKFAFITDDWGGQSIVSADIRNWIGTKSISGFDLAEALEGHLRDQEGVEILNKEKIAGVAQLNKYFSVTTESGKVLETKYILVTTGSRRRKINVPGEAQFDGKGVAYCSTCDAPLFNGKDVAVLGGGNAGLEAVIDLIPYAKKIYLMEYADTLRGDPVTREKVMNAPSVEVMTMTETVEIKGETFVSGLVYKNRTTNETKELPVGGVFVEIGSIPNADFVKALVETNKFGEIIVDPKTQKSSNPGIWAAGDVTDVIYKQNNIAMGDAVRALLNIYEALIKE